MSLLSPGDTIEAADFIRKADQSADPADDTGRAPILENDGRLHADFTMPAGIYFPFAGASGDIPAGFLLCDGASYLRADYPDLFAAIGTLWGAADGTHFNVPNLKGRVPVGYDAAQTEFDSVGENGGEKTHVLSKAELPSYNLDVSGARAHFGGSGSNHDSGSGTDNYTSLGSLTVPLGGSGSAHNNLQPYAVSHYIIKT